MIVEHRPGRTVADTDAMAALTGRTPWTIRAHGVRPDGRLYDHDATLAAIATVPEPVLLNASQAQAHLGLRAGTVRQWAHRGRIRSLAKDRAGRPLYDLADLLRLARPSGELAPRCDGV